VAKSEVRQITEGIAALLRREKFYWPLGRIKSA
jgi:hypothetical protein